MESIFKYKQEANRLISSFEKGEIILTDEFVYKDYRKKEEKKDFNKREENVESNQAQLVLKGALKDRVCSKIQVWLQKLSFYKFH